MPSPPAAAAAAEAAMAAAVRPAAFPGDEDDFDDSDEETVEAAFGDDDGAKLEPQQRKPPPRAASSNPIPNLNGGAGDVDDGYPTPQRKRQRGAASAEARKPPAAMEESRRLFQRLWTDEDEIVILEGFLDFTSCRGSHHDTGPFYDQIKARLRKPDFNKSQLVEKLRRLKKKFRTVATRITSGGDFAFKTPHDQATFVLSRQIWGNAAHHSRGGGGGDDDDDVDLTPHQIAAIPFRRKPRRRGRKRPVAQVAAEAPVEVKVAESHRAMAPVPEVVQETVRGCLSPMFKELLCCAVGGRTGAAGAGGLDGLRHSLLPLGVGANQVEPQSAAAMAAQRWRKQRIQELEVFSRRMELLQEQIKLMLRELHTGG